MWIAGGAILGLLVLWKILSALFGGGSTDTTIIGGATGPATVSESPPPVSVLHRSASAVYPLPAKAELVFKVVSLGRTPFRCDPATLDYGAESATVYHYACRGGGTGFTDEYFFAVRMTNTSSFPITVNVHDFQVRSTTGKVVEAFDAQGAGATPTRYLPDSATLGPDASVHGWVSFDAASGFTPQSLRYATNQGSLTVRFEGTWHK